MRLLYIFLSLFSFIGLQAQNIAFTDANFETTLLSSSTTNAIALNGAGNPIAIDANSDGFISVAEVSAVVELNISNQNIADIAEISNFVNLETIDCSYNSITELNFSQNPLLDTIDCSYNTPLIIFILKNGTVSSFNDLYINANGCVNIQFACADSGEEMVIYEFFVNMNPNIVINSYCSFQPGGSYSTIKGLNQIDANNNGCDPNDTAFIPYLQYNVTDTAGNSGVVYSDSNGLYNVFSGIVGTVNITPVVPNPVFYSATPNPASYTLTATPMNYTQDFCIEPLGVFNDLEVFVYQYTSLLPLNPSEFKILYRNMGTTIQNGNIEMQFDDNYMDFTSATPSNNTQAFGMLTWNFSNLMPYESRIIDVSFQLNQANASTYPTYIGQILNFTAIANPVSGDYTPNNNTHTLSATVVNSYDPNDKTCLQGAQVGADIIGEYVQYLIRFENTGTANAQNIVVKDEIDPTKFDISTLKLLNGSHTFYAEVKGNEVEFIFQNIDLPFTQPDSQGYVLFQVKTLASLNIGDTFSNDAEIYFDYNAPIITNDYQTEITTMEVEDIDPSNSIITLYPNPASSVVFIQTEATIHSIELYDASGKIIRSLLGNMDSLNIETLPQGNYFLNIHVDNQIITQSFIKR